MHCVTLSEKKTSIEFCKLNLIFLMVSQYSVVLQCEEHIAEECRRKPHQGVSTLSHGRHQEFCLHMSKSHMVLPIPLNVTPGFITDIGMCKQGS